MNKVLLYGDVSLNIIDGSSVWLVSMTKTLSEIFDEVHVVLKAPVENDRLLHNIRDLPRVHIHSSTAGSALVALDSRRAAQRIAGLVHELDPSAVVIRGTDVCAYAVGNDNIASRLWAYVTDLPFPTTRISPRGLARLARIAGRSRRMFAQTESARSYLEGICPEAAGKTVLLTPMVPDEFFALPLRTSTPGEPLRLVYSGKMAKDWRTLQMLDIPRELSALGIDAELTMIGDKFQKDRQDRTWHLRMEEALRAAHEDPGSGVTWAGGMSRQEALDIVGSSDLGLSWRSAEMNASLELSTKVLEYSTVGTPALVNRCQQHEELFGADYPLMLDADDPAEVARVISRISRGQLRRLGPMVRKTVRQHSTSVSADRLRADFARAHALDAPLPGGLRPTRIVVASHDFKFMGELLAFLEASPAYELRVDRWSSLREHDEKRSAQLVEWADVVFCEWCGPNAVWYQHHKRPGQRLVVRLHRFEVRGPWIPDLDFTQIDRLVFVSELQERLSREVLDLPEETPTAVIPNAIDTVDLNRPKVAGAEFHLGVLGMVPYLKRPDRAVDLLEKLLETDERYVLHLRGRMPWEYPYEWNKPLQQQLYLDLFARLRQDPALREHVVFEPFAADVASWFRRIGVILSPSTSESFHLATAEGMASGALPIVWDRPGSREIFSDDHVYPTLEEAADRVLAFRDREDRRRHMPAFREYVAGWDIATLTAKWDEAFTPTASRSILRKTAARK